MNTSFVDFTIVDRIESRNPYQIIVCLFEQMQFSPIFIRVGLRADFRIINWMAGIFSWWQFWFTEIERENETVFFVRCKSHFVYHQ